MNRWVSGWRGMCSCIGRIIETLSHLPSTLTPFFQEYDFATLDPQADSHTIIERVLQFGNRAEIRWLFKTYSDKEIRTWIEKFGNEKLPQPHRTFWQLILDIRS